MPAPAHPIRFLIDEDLPRSLAPLIRAAGYDALDVRDAGLRGHSDQHIAEYARSNARCLITGDFGFASTPTFPPHQHAGIVVLEFPNTLPAPAINRLALSLIAEPDLVARLPGRLAIVEFGRVRLFPP